jgi:hypothetical protein
VLPLTAAALPDGSFVPTPPWPCLCTKNVRKAASEVGILLATVGVVMRCMELEHVGGNAGRAHALCRVTVQQLRHNTVRLTLTAVQESQQSPRHHICPASVFEVVCQHLGRLSSSGLRAALRAVYS